MVTRLYVTIKKIKIKTFEAVEKLTSSYLIIIRSKEHTRVSERYTTELKREGYVARLTDARLVAAVTAPSSYNHQMFFFLLV